MPKNKSMTYQVKQELYAQMRFGQSKYEARRTEGTRNPEGIFSKETMKSYIKQCTAFANWAKATYGCKTLDEAFPYVRSYIEYRIGKGLSAWTVKLDLCAIAKMYHFSSQDFDIPTPARKREDIVRSRSPCEHDKHFSEEKNKDVVDFCKATGLRKHELQQLKCKDIYQENGKVKVHVEKGKGGKAREVEVRPGYEYHVWAYAQNNGEQPVFEKNQIKNRMDEHAYRAEYAKGIYELYKRPLDTLTRSEKYYCRNDKCGQVYDKAAMLIASRNLGHNRIDVIASNYLY